MGKDDIGLPTDGSSSPISYRTAMFNNFTGEDIDAAVVPSYDAGAPPVLTDGPLYLDQGGSAIDYTADSAVEATVVHLHGATDDRAEVVDLPATGAEKGDARSGSGG